MRPLVFQACSPLLLMAVVITGCSSAPSFMRVECTGEAVHRGAVVDHQTGQLFSHCSQPLV